MESKKILEELTKERGTHPEMVMAPWLQWFLFSIFLLSSGLMIFSGSIFLAILCVAIAFTFTPYKPYQKWLKHQVDAFTKFLNNLLGSLFVIAVTIIVGGLLIWGGLKIINRLADILIPDKWTLMVCDEKLNEYECYSNSDVIPDFKSKNECLLAGASNFSKQGYECGSNCREDDGLFICKEVCNRSGCH